MQKDKIFVISLLSMVLFFGCSGDKEDVKGECGVEGEIVCGGVCVSLGTESHCFDCNPCGATQVCRDKACVEACSFCREDERCDSGRCVLKRKLGESCVGSEECVKPYECLEGKCGESLKCSEEQKCGNGYWCYKEVCRSHLEVGEVCEGEEIPEGLGCNSEEGVCYDGVCVKYPSLGEKCDEDLGLDCKEGFCIDGHCRVKDVGEGESCDDIHLCGEGFHCYEARCKLQKKEGDDCVLGEEPCGERMLCVFGKCSKVVGENICSSHSECYADSYCCEVKDCGEPRRCVRYNLGSGYDHDASCRYQTKKGIFEASVQCFWSGQGPEQYKDYNKVEMPPMVGVFGNNRGIKKPLVAFYSFNKNSVSVGRIIHPETCETLETIELANMSFRWWHMPAAGDLDGDGLMEIVFLAGKREYTQYGDYLSKSWAVAFKWSEEQKKHVVMWTSEGEGPFYHDVSIFDVTGDGKAEVIDRSGNVYRGLDGKKLNTNNTGTSVPAALGDFDADGHVEMATQLGVYRWINDSDGKGHWDHISHFYVPKVLDAQGKEIRFNVEKDDKGNDRWVIAENGEHVLHYERGYFMAYADFGTAGEKAEDFNYEVFDGIPEIVASGGHYYEAYEKSGNAAMLRGGSVSLFTLSGQLLMFYNRYNNKIQADGRQHFELGGPPTIGDFNGDGKPEIAVASRARLGVYDPKCKQTEVGKCLDKYVVWEQEVQDYSSGQTGSAVFDFDGDGQVEVVYADECFTRVFDGKSGEVLFSSKRSSHTSYEGPNIVDVDGDGSVEILMGSDYSVACRKDGVDWLDSGVRCMEDKDCLSKRCVKGRCSCERNEDCNWQVINGQLLEQYVCVDRLDSNEKGYGKVCRAARGETEMVSGLMILRDRLDRWVSARQIWNQHGYNVVNIQDNGQVWSSKVVDGTSDWLKAFRQKMSDNPVQYAYNSYRKNSQGLYGAGQAPDLTVRFDEGDICSQSADGGQIKLSGVLCNRGSKPVPRNLPASFYLGKDKGKHICTAFTESNVEIGKCPKVSCMVPSDFKSNDLVGKTIIMVANDDGNKHSFVVECNESNNEDFTEVKMCNVVN